jgi:YfiH family protein
MNFDFPKKVRFISTPKVIEGGHSLGQYENFNLATHTNDNLENVKKNRLLLIEKFNLPNAPKYLEQIHSDTCVTFDKVDELTNIVQADAAITKKKGVVCCVLTADCLPIFACDKQGTTVGVCHAGWQGILNGVIESFIKKMAINANDTLVSFGVAIGPKSLELGEDVYLQFIKKDKSFQKAFQKSKQKLDKYYLDIYKVAMIILNQQGIKNIKEGGLCSVKNKDYFSYRRQGVNSGRHAHLIWLE